MMSENAAMLPIVRLIAGRVRRWMRSLKDAHENSSSVPYAKALSDGNHFSSIANMTINIMANQKVGMA